MIVVFTWCKGTKLFVDTKEKLYFCSRKQKEDTNEERLIDSIVPTTYGE